MSKNIQLGWFNAWIGYVWILLFIPSLQYFLTYESFLQSSHVPVIITHTKIKIKRDSSRMDIVTEKGVFYHYNKDNYDIIINAFKTNTSVEVWRNKDNKNTSDFRVNGKFILERSNLGIILYSIGLIISGGMIILSTVLVVKTKGWGTYKLMEEFKNKPLWTKAP